MDYVREELLRQRKVLAALMVGETPETAERETVAEKRQEVILTEQEAENFWASAAKRSRMEQVGMRLASRIGESMEARKTEPVPVETEVQMEGNLLYMPDPATGRMAEVRQMSRAIQRDARRYDGGFSIY